MRRTLALVASAAVLAGCYFGRDRQSRRVFYFGDGLIVVTGAALVIGGAVHDAECDEPHCEQTARNLYGSGGALMMLGAMFAIATYLFTPPDQLARGSRSPRPTNAPTEDVPE